MRTRSILAVVLAGCGARVDVSIDGSRPDDAPAGVDAAAAADAGADAMLGAWSTPVVIPNGGTDGLAEDDGSPSAVETELVFSGRLPGLDKDLHVMIRPTRQDPWGPATTVPGINTTAGEQTPRITDDGLDLYFGSARAGGPGGDDIWTATRTAPGAAWGPPSVVATVNAAADDRTLTPCQDNRYVMISFRDGTGDVFEGVFGGGAPTRVATLSDGTATETGTFVSADCLRIWFASDRDGSIDIFHGHRATVTDPWILDGKVAELSTDLADESDPWISPDGRRLVMTSNADGENDIYESSR